MKLARVIFLVTGAAGAVAVALAIGSANRAEQPAAGAPTATPATDASTEAPSQEAAPLQAADLRDVHVPDNLKGFERLVGSPARGEVVITQRLSCLDCHSIEPGENTGYPNLSDVGRRLRPKQLVTSILEPSRDFADGYESVTILTTDGRTIRGVEVDSNDQIVVLRTGQGEETVRRDQIEGMTISTSDMPDGLVDDLTPQEFADLIAALINLGAEKVVAAK
jgi:putative heme-binding domain-containing protein